MHAVNPENGYTSSVFEVAHDHGLKTGFYWAPNHFFRLTKTSYNSENGRDHKYGRQKIDHIVGAGAAERIQSLAQDRPDLSFIYFPDADRAGHKYGYLGNEFRDALAKVDVYLGDILEFVENDPQWKDKTIIIFTADHGGKPETKGHGDYKHPHVYIIPFMIWGPGVGKGIDLYDINQSTRKDPGDGRPKYARSNQPIRNGDLGNLALKMLGLPHIPGSFMNNKQDLQVK